MMCPNKNSPEWKRLVQQVGLVEALKQFNENKIVPLFDEDLQTSDNSTVYSVKKDSESDKPVGNIYGRISNFMEFFWSGKPMKEAEEIIKEQFAKENKSLNDTIERSVNGKMTKLTFEEAVKKVEESQETKRLKGKFFHKLIEFGGNVSFEVANRDYLITSDDYIDLKELYEVVKEKGYFDLEKDDIVTRENIVSVDGFELPFVDNEGNKIVVNGLAGSIDETIQHEDGTLSLRDFKTGALSSYSKAMFSKMLTDKKLQVSALNKAKLQIILYAMMLKINNPNLQFRKLQILKIPLSGDNQEAVYFDAMEELHIFLPIIQNYFKANGININPEIFDEKNYVKSNQSLSSLMESLKTSNNPYQEAKKILLGRLDYNERMKLSETNLEKIAQYEQLINEILYQIDELENGYSTIKTGQYKKSMDFISSFINDKDRVSNPLVKTFTRLFNEANVKLNKARAIVSNEFKKYLTPVTSRSADYKSTFSWFWEGGAIVTYKSNKWNSLTKEQKEYSDYYRWNVRFHLFKAMNPKKGIEIIKLELQDRINWDGLDKNILIEQIEELRELCWTYQGKLRSVNKLGFFKYYEGWTPRVAKTDEEKSYSEYWSTADKFTLNESEINQLELAKSDKTTNSKGITLMYMPEDGLLKQQAGEYTFNPNIIFSAFVDNAMKKQYYDDVVNVGNAISSFLQEKDKFANTKFFAPLISYIDNILLGAVKGLDRKQLGTFEVERKSLNINTGKYEYQGETDTYSADKMAKAVKNMVSFVSMAFQPLASVRRGISGTITYFINSISDDLASFVGVKNVEFGTKDATMSWFNSWHLNISFKKDEMKVYLMSQMFGNLPDGYDISGRGKDSLIKRADPWLYNKLKETGFVLDKVVDNANFNATMIAKMRAMKVEGKNGDIISMWEAYEVIDGKLIYTGKLRGVDEITKQPILGLSEKEITKLKALSKKMYGAYREEEKIGLELGVLGAIYMQFKKFAVPIYMTALGQKFDNESMGQYIDTGNLDKDGNKILAWKGKVEEGFILSIISLMKMTLMLKGNFKEAWNKFDDGQKRGVVFGLVKASAFLILGKMIANGFGDDDDDDKNKIKQIVNQIKREVASEFDLYSTIQTITSIPVGNKAKEIIDGIYSLTIDSALRGERIESGMFRNGYFGESIPNYKGVPQILKNLPITSTIWNTYRQSIDWQEIQEDIE